MARQERTFQLECRTAQALGAARGRAGRPSPLRATERGRRARQGAPIPTNRSFATEAFGTTALEPGSQGRPELQAPELASQRHPLPEPEFPPQISQARN